MSDSPNGGRGGRGRRGGRGGRGRRGGRGGRGGRGNEGGGSRGAWRGGGRGGEHSGEPGSGRGGRRGDGHGRVHRSVGRGRGERGSPHGSGDSDRERSPSRGASSPIPLLALRDRVGRPGIGNSGRRIKLESNHVEVEVDPRTIYHYDVVILPDNGRSIDQNFRIIRALQRLVEGPVSSGVYDGRKNFFTSADPEFESDAQEFVVVMGAEFRIRLTRVNAASINTEVLSRFVNGEQRHDNDVLMAITALNIVVRMQPSIDFPSNKNSFFPDQDPRPIGAGMELWRGCFQSVRPAIGRMLINVDISTGVMYRSGRLIDLALDCLGRSGSPNILSPQHGFPDRERLRLQQFISGIKITTPHHVQNPDRRRLVKKVTRDSARDHTFENGDGQTMTVLEYFRDSLNIMLQFPDLICVELSSRAVIPLELCEVPPGQFVRKHIPPGQIRSILEFSTMRPDKRVECIRDGLRVLQYGQSQYVHQFGMNPLTNNLVELEARIIKAPTLKYNPESKRPNLQPGNGTWNMLDKLMFKSAEIPNWVVLIYERQQRFRPEIARQMITDLVKTCEEFGITINHQPALMKWESGQGNISRQLRAACEECQRKSRAAPSLIVAVLPDSAADIYTAIKHFGDVSAGIATQCMKSSKCFRARQQYYANVSLKINVKLGGTNVVAEPQDISFLTDSANPAMIMGADITHPPPGSKGRPSYTSVVGSVDSNGAKYVSRIAVQTSPQELIEDMEDMCTHIFEQYKAAMGKFPKRILFYRDGVSEGEFEVIINKELDDVRKTCAKLGFAPKITLIVVGKYHKVVFFPKSGADRTGNCPPGTVVDTTVVSPVEFDYYLYGHAGLLGTSKPAHYNVLLDENGFTPDGIQSLSFALCHVYARCTRSVSIPAPVYYAHNVCSRAKNHYDPQQGQRLFDPDIVAEATTQASGGTSASGSGNEYQRGFQHTHENMARVMYFC